MLPRPLRWGNMAADLFVRIRGRRDSAMSSMHEIDYEILGDDLQFVKIELDPGEAVIGEAGAMMYIEDGIQMQTIFGDGSQQQQGGFMNALLGAGKRLLIGES